MIFVRSVVAMLLIGLFLSGCGRSGMGLEGEVSGKVTYNGKPLPGGQVKFLTSDGHMFTGTIDAEGNYKVRALVGEARIIVDNRMLEKRKGKSPQGGLRPPPGVEVKSDLSKMSGGQPLTGTYVRIPDKYRSPDDSGLTYTVTMGSQTHDIQLSDKP